MADPTQDDLDAAESAVRRYCGWHVTPEVTEDIVLDGPGSPLLVLPTLRLVALTAVTECGVDIDPDYVSWSTRGLLRKKYTWPYAYPSIGVYWTPEYQGVTVTVTHGFADVPDFDRGVRMVAESLASTARDDHSMILKRVDDVQYQWSPQAVESIVGTHLLAPYRLERQP